MFSKDKKFLSEYLIYNLLLQINMVFKLYVTNRGCISEIYLNTYNINFVLYGTLFFL